MFRRYREFWSALMVVVALTVLYIVVYQRAGEAPPAAHWFGHGLGIVGFILMLMTETLYSLRKQSANARWGSMAAWLRFHMFTGMVGPYMVLLHPAIKFQGLAGAVTLLTVIVVISGMIGRYIYSAVPRTLDGAEQEVSVLESEIQQTERALVARTPPGASMTSPEPQLSPSNTGLVLGRAWQDTRARWQDWRAVQGMSLTARQEARELRVLLRRRRSLQRQIDTLMAARRLLALWRSIHVPLAMVLFVTALVHIIGAVYYATLLR